MTSYPGKRVRAHRSFIGNLSRKEGQPLRGAGRKPFRLIICVGHSIEVLTLITRQQLLSKN